MDFLSWKEVEALPLQGLGVGSKVQGVEAEVTSQPARNLHVIQYQCTAAPAMKSSSRFGCGITGGWRGGWCKDVLSIQVLGRGASRQPERPVSCGGGHKPGSLQPYP